MVGTMSKQLFGIAFGDHCPALGVEKDAVVADCKDARQFVSHDYDRRAEIVAQFEDQIVEQARAYRIETGGWLVEEKYFRVKCDRPREPRPLLHPAAYLARIVALESFESDQRKFQRTDFADFFGREIAEFFERQTDVLRQRHRAPQSAALIEHAEFPQHRLALERLCPGEIEIAVEHFALGRLDKTEHMPEQGALTASAAAHDYEDVAMVDGEVQILHQDEISECHGEVFHRDRRRPIGR